jgi:internalin A
VVINKIDLNLGYDVNRRGLMDKYSNIKGFCRVSCRTEKGIKELKEKLNNEISAEKHIKTLWPKNWFKIKEQLENMNKQFITLGDYKEMCKKKNIKETQNQNTLVDFLHDLGVILHFRDYSLLDTHVLDPKWVTKAIYKIINSKILAENEGVLNLKRYDSGKNDLDHILRSDENKENYPETRDVYFIELMKKFELCYEIDDQKMLFPNVLDIQEPEFDFNFEDSLKFVLDYDDFLPPSMLPRFIVKMHKDIKDDLKWRTGLILENKDFKSTALVKSDENRRIYIYVDGEQRRDYFQVILGIFRTINNSFKKLEVKELVPLPDSPEITVSYKHLINLEKRGIKEYLVDGADEEYNVGELLGIVQNENTTEKEILQIVSQILTIITTEEDTEQTMMQKLDEIVEAKPGLFGFSVDVKKLVKILKNRNQTNKNDFNNIH